MTVINQVLHRIIKQLCLLLFLTHFSFAQGKLEIYPGAFLKAEGAVFITCSDIHLINEGDFEPGASTVTFENNNNQNLEISGNSPTPFYKLEVDMMSNELVLNRVIDVSHSLVFLSGYLELNNQQVALASDAKLINENELNRATGLNGGQLNIPLETIPFDLQNYGNLGMHIFSDEGLGSITLERGQTPQIVGAESGIARWFNLIPSINTEAKASFRFYYFDAELQGISESELGIWKFENGIPVFIGSDDRDEQENWIQINDVDPFALWTLAPAPPITNLVSRMDEEVKIDENKQSTNKGLETQTKSSPVIELFPNPVSEVLHVNLSHFKKGEAIINIYDLNGRLLSTKNTNVSEELTSLSLPEIKTWVEGVYLLQVITDEKVSEVFPFTKVN